MKTAAIQPASITTHSQATQAATTTWTYTKRVAFAAGSTLQQLAANCVNGGVRFGSWAAKNVKVFARHSFDLGVRVASLVLKYMRFTAHAFADGAGKTVAWMGRAIRFGGHEALSLIKRVSYAVANFGVHFAYAARHAAIAAKNGAAAGYAAGRIYLAQHRREAAAAVFGLALITAVGYGIHHFISRKNPLPETLPLGSAAPQLPDVTVTDVPATA